MATSMEVPNSEIFSLLLSGETHLLWDYPRDQLKPFLPFICHLILQGEDKNEEINEQNGAISTDRLQSLLYELEETNKVMNYLRLDFVELRSDALKEQRLLRKLTPNEIVKKDRVLVTSFESGRQIRLAIEFERSPEERRFRLVLSELLRVITQVDSSFELMESDLFECEVYFIEVGHIISIAVKELSSVLPLTQVIEGLLRVKNGPHLICYLMANLPYYFKKVITSLVLNGETLDEISLAGRLRSQTLRHLVTLFPSQASYVQWLSFTNQKLPTLMIFIALDIEEGRIGGMSKGGGVLSLMSDIVIHGDKDKRNWFLQYMKLMQQKYRRHSTSAVTALRKYLMKKLIYFITHGNKTTPTSEESMQLMEVEETTSVPMVKDEEIEEGEREEGEERMDTATLELVDQMEIEISEVEEEEKEKISEPKIKEKKVHTPRVRHSSFSLEHISFPLISLSNQLIDSTILQLTELLHVCCGLKIQVHMYLTNEESAAILRLITCTCPPFSSAGVQFIEIALSILLACPFLINSEEGEQAVMRWLNWLLENIPEFEKAIPGERMYGEMLLLVAIHLQEKQLKEIEKLIMNVLGMKTMNSFGSGQFSTLKDLFLKVFKEDVVCSHALSVPPTPSLSGHMTGYLPVHCIHQLMCSKAFRRHDISVKEWIYKQLCLTQEPLHPTMSLIVEEYVLAMLVTPFTSSARSCKSPITIVQTPFTAEEVLSVFKSDQTTPINDHTHSISTQILMLYYVLYYQENHLTQLKTLLMHSNIMRGRSESCFIPKAYAPSVLLQLPVKKLLYHVSEHQESYQSVYPSLLRLIVSHFPHLCLPEDWIKQDSINQSINVRPILRLSSRKVTVEVATTILSNLLVKPSQAFLVLSHLSSLPLSSLVPFSSSLVSTLPLLLDGTSKKIEQFYATLWMKLNSIIPRKLWVDTVNALRPSNHKTHPVFTHQNLLEDPLIVLRCDPRVFRCSSVFEILLRILAAYTSASRVWLSEHAHTLNCIQSTQSPVPSHPVTSQEREELRIALTAAQESSIIQLLLEICLPTEDDKKEAAILGPQLTVLREVQCMVCSYLHQVFISEPGMVKLIHFQGYPPILLPLLVTGVPSMHIVTDFLPELLTHHELEKQVFGIQLASHVIHQYPLADHMTIVMDIFKKLHLLIDDLPHDRLATVFTPFFPSMVLFCQTYPNICVDATEILLHLCRVSILHSKSSNNQKQLPLDATILMREFNDYQQTISLTTADTLAATVVKGGKGKDKELGAVKCEKRDEPEGKDGERIAAASLKLSQVSLLEERIHCLSKMSLTNAVKWTFEEISNTVLLKVSCKTS